MKSLAHQGELAAVVAWAERLEPHFAGEAGGVVLELLEGVTPQRVTQLGVPEASSREQLRELGQRLYARAFEEAEGAGNGLHRFRLRALLGASEVESKRFKVLVASAPEDPRQEEDSRTLLSATRSHLESVMRLSIEKDHATFMALGTILETMNARPTSYEKSAVEREKAESERLKTMHELLVTKVRLDEEVEERAEARAIKRQFLEPIANELGPMVPLLAAKVAGKMMGNDDDDDEKDATPEPPKLDPSIPVTVEAPRVVELRRHLRSPRRARK